MKCIICDQQSHKKNRQKSRISEYDRASSFLKAAQFHQDEVFTRICDIQDEFTLFGSEILYHNACITGYLKMPLVNKSSASKTSLKQTAWQAIVEDLNQGLQSGTAYPLSTIRDYLNRNLNPSDTAMFRNRDVKVYLV